jgi:hypothetical protein
LPARGTGYNLHVLNEGYYLVCSTFTYQAKAHDGVMTAFFVDVRTAL